MSDAPRSVEEIEAEIQRTRLAMQSTVDELSGRLDPRTQAKVVADQAKTKAAEFSQRAQGTFEAAKEGDPTALATLASIATGVVAVAGILLLRKRR